MSGCDVIKLGHNRCPHVIITIIEEPIFHVLKLNKLSVDSKPQVCSIQNILTCSINMLGFKDLWSPSEFRYFNHWRPLWFSTVHFRCAAERQFNVHFRLRPFTFRQVLSAVWRKYDVPLSKFGTCLRSEIHIYWSAVSVWKCYELFVNAVNQSVLRGWLEILFIIGLRQTAFPFFLPKWYSLYWSWMFGYNGIMSGTSCYPNRIWFHVLVNQNRTWRRCV